MKLVQAKLRPLYSEDRQIGEVTFQGYMLIYFHV